MGILKGCKPRKEVLTGELDDAIFAADFGDLIAGKAPRVYGDAATFFQNTHPAAQLCKVIEVVFGRLANAKEGGATIRLSTSFGGGKTHTLMAMWHLARTIGDLGMGTDLLPAAGRPKKVTVAAVDGSDAGEIFARHGQARTRSLWGELAYQLGGEAAWKGVGQVDDPEKQPDQSLVESWFPGGPVLLLLDELVVYMATLSERGQGNLLAFLGKLTSVVSNRPQTAVVVTDPADQQVYALQSADLAKAIAAASNKLDDILGRKVSDFDPVSGESAQVIVRRLFESVDGQAAQAASKVYYDLYERVTRDQPGCVPTSAASAAYAKRILTCYPFHPRLIETAQDRLAAMPDFHRSRGTLRLFARILRSVWQKMKAGQIDDLELITAGEIDWLDASLQADLISRLNRDHFRPAISADIERHAHELDNEATWGIHRRVASALLLESLPLQANSGLDKAELTVAILRPDEAGPEPGEALDRLLGTCWHTYPMAGGRGWQFRYEPNIIKQIEERMADIPVEDARSRVLTEVQGFFGGPAYRLAAWPKTSRQVPDTADLQLALCETEELARQVCDYGDDANPQAPFPRTYKNAIVAIGPTPTLLSNAIERAQRFLAADAIERENRRGDTGKLVRDQLSKIQPEFHKQFRLQAYRAFNRVVLSGGRVFGIEERFQLAGENILQTAKGQVLLREFLEEKGLVYKGTDGLDRNLFIKAVLPGAIRSAEHKGAMTTRQIHERILAAPGLRLVPDMSVTRQTIQHALREGKLVLRDSGGRVYDASGAVEGPQGKRRRSASTLASVPIDDETLVVESSDALAKGWLQVDPLPGEKPDDGGLGISPPPPPAGRGIALDWDQAVTMAADRPLLTLVLRASTPAASQSLLSLAQPLGAESLTLSVLVTGDGRDGGRINFAADDLKPTHPLKPLDLAGRLFAALVDGSTFEASLRLSFGSAGRSGLGAALADAREKSPDAVAIEATFAAPAEKRT
jgi:hypothetical protein